MLILGTGADVTMKDGQARMVLYPIQLTTRLNFKLQGQHLLALCRWLWAYGRSEGQQKSGLSNQTIHFCRQMSGVVGGDREAMGKQFLECPSQQP